MRNSKEREQRAVNHLLNERGLETITETHVTPDFVEVYGTIGGDVLRFRVYDKNGEFMVTEK